MTNIASVELNEVRPFFSLAMKVRGPHTLHWSSDACRLISGETKQRLVALDPEEQAREEAGYLHDDATADKDDADFL